MKSLLAKFRVSAALDSDRAGRRSPGENSQTEEVKRYATSLQKLDRRLKTASVSDRVPDDLHASNIRAIRAAMTQRPAPVWFGWRWLPVPALGLVLVAGLVWALNRPPTKTPIAPVMAANSVMEKGRDLTQSTPAAALEPLSKELKALNQDLENAVKFLAASVP